jgi:hypothetical protein
MAGFEWNEAIQKMYQKDFDADGEEAQLPVDVLVKCEHTPETTECLGEDHCVDLAQAEMFAAALERVLLDVCNEFMEVDEDGRFTSGSYCDEVNRLLGI